ncbi:MAG: hypothetical protein ACK4F7_07910, partial [Inhella sp.]
MNEVLRAVVEAANLAPTADNSAPWRFQAGNDALTIMAKQAEPVERTRRRLDWISLGCAVESACIRLTRFGLAGELHLGDANAAPRATILWSTASSVRQDPLDLWLSARHSNRSLIYKGPALDREQCASMEGEALKVSGSVLTWLDEPDRRKAAVGLIQKAEQLRFSKRELHEELYSAVQFNAGWRSSCETGIPPGALGALLPERAGFKALKRWQLQRLANCVGAHRMLGLRSAGLPARWTPHLLAI